MVATGEIGKWDGDWRCFKCDPPREIAVDCACGHAKKAHFGGVGICGATPSTGGMPWPCKCNGYTEPIPCLSCATLRAEVARLRERVKQLRRPTGHHDVDKYYEDEKEPSAESILEAKVARMEKELNDIYIKCGCDGPDEPCANCKSIEVALDGKGGK